MDRASIGISKAKKAGQWMVCRVPLNTIQFLNKRNKPVKPDKLLTIIGVKQ